MGHYACLRLSNSFVSKKLKSLLGDLHLPLRISSFTTAYASLIACMPSCCRRASIYLISDSPSASAISTQWASSLLFIGYSLGCFSLNGKRFFDFIDYFRIESVSV